MATVEVSADAEILARAVAHRFLQTVVDLQQAGKTPQIALTGGTIADQIHREIGALATEYDVDWQNIVFWWGDERFVAATSDDRNSLQAQRAFLDAVGVDPEKVHPMPADTGQGLEAAVADFEAVVREYGAGAFDLVMLGLGPDGHVASLFPGYPQLDITDQIAAGVTDSPKPPPLRITFTYPALNRSDRVWFLVSGTGKAAAVREALTGADPHTIPATGVTGRAETVWLLDKDAASEIS